MNSGIELLLKRMETHPEEFYPVHDPITGNLVKFGGVVSYIMGWNSLGMATGNPYDFLSEEDRQAFRDGINKLRAEEFATEIFKKVMGAEDPKPQPFQYQPYSQTITLSTGGAGVTPGQSSGAGSNMYVSQQALHHQQLQGALFVGSPRPRAKLNMMEDFKDCFKEMLQDMKDTWKEIKVKYGRR
jgi:hypothetical protein